MVTKEELEQISDLIDRKIAKDREERKQSLERIIKSLDKIAENAKRREADVTQPLIDKVAQLERRLRVLELEKNLKFN